MLHLAHPLTHYTFEAARFEDQIRQRLVLLREDSSADRQALVDEMLRGPLAELRRLLHEHFDDRPGIASKLDAIEDGMRSGAPVTDIWHAFLRLGELSKDTFGTGFI